MVIITAKKRSRRIEALLDTLSQRSDQVLSLVMDWRCGAKTAQNGKTKASTAMDLEKRRQWLALQVDYLSSHLNQDNKPTGTVKDARNWCDCDCDCDCDWPFEV